MINSVADVARKMTKLDHLEEPIALTTRWNSGFGCDFRPTSLWYSDVF